MPQRNVKEQLVEGASQVLLERGYHAASVGDIVAAAGIPKGSVYNHFDSKEDLAMEVVRRYVDSYPWAVLLEATGSPMGRLRIFFEQGIERTVARGVEAGCLLGNFSTELVGHSDPISDLVAASLAQWGSSVTTVLAEAQEQGELDRGLDVDVLGPYVVDAFEGSVARAKVSGTRAPLDTFLDFTFTVLLKP
jgi:TetR/AcrR family transcriptional regulator, transcriptional repressor for nem operon